MRYQGFEGMPELLERVTGSAVVFREQQDEELYYSCSNSKNGDVYRICCNKGIGVVFLDCIIPVGGN